MHYELLLFTAIHIYIILQSQFFFFVSCLREERQFYFHSIIITPVELQLFFKTTNTHECTEVFFIDFFRLHFKMFNSDLFRFQRIQDVFFLNTRFTGLIFMF